MIDLMSQLSYVASQKTFGSTGDKSNQIVVLYSTRDRSLHEWAAKTFDNLLSDIDTSLKDLDELAGASRIRIVLACTAKKEEAQPKRQQLDDTLDLDEDFSLREFLEHLPEKDMEANATKLQTHNSGSIEVRSSRLDYKLEIPEHSFVFCQGSSDYKKVVAGGCRGKDGMRLYFD